VVKSNPHKLLDADDDGEPEGREVSFSGAAIFSLIIHTLIMTILVLRQFQPKPAAVDPELADRPPAAERVYLPPLSQLRKLAPPPAVPTAPPSTPATEARKDKISIGPPDARRAKELLLRRDQPIPKTSQGNGVAADEAKKIAKGRTPEEPTPPPTEATPVTGAQEALRFPIGPGEEAPNATPRPSILGSLHRLEERWQQSGGKGLGLGKTGPKHMGIAEFDPEGADFTEWINHLTAEVYRNWIQPEAARMGFRGHVAIAFKVARDGTIIALQVLQSSGTVSLDGAAKGALLGSRLLPLPADFGSETLTLTVTFYYNEEPRAS
jgi:TonB family protein